jgi:3'-phosphoadenosine 5'-phosphosulfate sulfotransferase (PAPS reductase)/FAD synthetase
VSSQTKYVVGFSGGIDSQAAARYTRNYYGDSNTILVNSDAGGNEHPLTSAFVGQYSREVFSVVRLEAVVGDVWTTPGFAETKGLSSSAPLGFPTLAMLKGRWPSRTAQFCTEILKLRPLKRWLGKEFGPSGVYAGLDYVLVSGVRRDESAKRSGVQTESWDSYFDCQRIAPLADWDKQRCFNFVQMWKEPVNPLYALGFKRVGCAPCINSGKDDISNWADRFPEMIDKVRQWEQQVGRTFFPPCVPGLALNWIDEVVAWSRTERGGVKLKVIEPRQACESAYGLCDTGQDDSE